MKTIEEIDQNEDPRPVSDPRDLKIDHRVTDLPGEAAVVVTGIRTNQDRDLGFVLIVSVPRRAIEFSPFAGTDYENPLPVTQKERAGLEAMASDMVPMVKAQALLSLFGVGHACSKCGKCGRKFDEQGNEVSGPTEDEGEDEDDSAAPQVAAASLN